jgi:hypothetical protein
MMVTGIVATSIGGLLALSGGMFLLMGDTTKCTTYDDGEVSCTGENYTRLGAGLAIGGTVLLAIGIPMVLVGASPKSRRVTSRASSQVSASVVVGGQSLLLRGTW